MVAIVFDQFKGMAPRHDPHLLPEGFAQTAANAKLIRGILQAWKTPSTVLATTTGINTIRRYKVGSTVNWLCWSGEVTSVANVVPGDDKQRVIWTDPADGIPKQSRNDKLVFTGNYVKDTTDHFRLGVPAPTAAPAVAISGEAPDPATIRAYVYAWAYRGRLGGMSSTMYVAVGRNQDVLLEGLDTDPSISTSDWPNAKITSFKKYIFQVNLVTGKYWLVGRVDNDATSFIHANGKKAIKRYGAGAFHASSIDAPTSAGNIITDDGTSTTGWTMGTGWTHGASSFTHAGPSAGDLTRAVTGLTIGVTYVIYATSQNQLAGTFDIKLDAATLKSSIAVNQMQIVTFTATATSHNIVFSASATCDVSILDIRIDDTAVAVSADVSTGDDLDERAYLYCYTYTEAGVPKRGDPSGVATIAGVQDEDPVVISGMSTGAGLPAGTKNIKKRIFRRDKANPPVYRLIATLPESQTEYSDVTPKKKLGKPITKWTLVSAGAPVTPSVALKTSFDNNINKQAAEYVYTYVTAWGEESAPSPTSVVVETLPWESVALTTGTTAPTGYSNITLKRFYRTDSTGQFRPVFEADVPIGTATVFDDVEEADLGPDPIITTLWDIPPGASATADLQLKGLVMLPNGVLCGGWGNQVGFSEPGYPYAWPVSYQFQLDYTFVAAAVTANGVVIGTTGTPYLCQGSDPASMIPIRIEQQQACIAAGTMVDMGDYAIYASPDGLVAVTGMDATLVTDEVITRDQWQAYAFKADGSVSTLKAWMYERRYLLAYNTGTASGMLLFDPADKSLVSFTLAPTAGFNDLSTDTLYLQIGSNIQKWDGGAALTYDWISRRHLLDHAICPAAARVDAASYPVTFKLYADGTLVHTQTVASNRAFRLPGGYRGFAFEAELTGTVDVRHAAIATSLEELA